MRSGMVGGVPGRLAQRESASFTPKRSLVRSQYRPPAFQELTEGFGGDSGALFRSLWLGGSHQGSHNSAPSGGGEFFDGAELLVDARAARRWCDSLGPGVGPCARWWA